MIEKSYTDEEIAAIVRKHGLPRYPKIALLREKLSRKAKEESLYEIGRQLKSEEHRRLAEDLGVRDAEQYSQKGTQCLNKIYFYEN